MWAEEGAVYKDPGGRLNVALVFPNTYHVGMSNLGLHTIYRVLNDHPAIVCERFFTDAERSVESGRALADFPLIAFSVSYELDWINMVRFLMEQRIPVTRQARGGAPVVLAGGAAVSMNPEPIADACDVCFLGDGEGLAQTLHEAYRQARGYEELLDALKERPGIYLPGLTEPDRAGYATTGFHGPVVTPALTEPLTPPAHTRILTRDTTFGDMFLVEIARGCLFGCKFCTARGIYHPFRAVALKELTPVLDRAALSGCKLGMISAAVNNHPEAELLYGEIAARALAIAPPSLRPGMITPALINLIEASGVRGVTLAPETGSEELRYAHGKRIANQTILSDVENLVAAGIRDIKLYFMVGTPGEGPAHDEATVDLIKRIRQAFIKVSRGNRRIGTLGVSINTFVPKPRSAYEREPFAGVVTARDHIRRITRGLRGQSNIHVTYEGPKWAYLQALLARGDREVLDLITALAGSEPSAWQRILREWPRNPDYYALRRIPADEILPWDLSS